MFTITQRVYDIYNDAVGNSHSIYETDIYRPFEMSEPNVYRLKQIFRRNDILTVFFITSRAFPGMKSKCCHRYLRGISVGQVNIHAHICLNYYGCDRAFAKFPTTPIRHCIRFQFCAKFVLGDAIRLFIHPIVGYIYTQ